MEQLHQSSTTSLVAFVRSLATEKSLKHKFYSKVGSSKTKINSSSLSLRLLCTNSRSSSGGSG